jgi:hypothetical protein
MGYIYDISFSASGDEYHFIVKRIIPPPNMHVYFLLIFAWERKADGSYEVEANFYDYVAQDLVEGGLAILKPYFVEKEANGEITICVSHLDGGGCPSTDEQIQAVLRWMASLHSATCSSKRTTTHRQLLASQHLPLRTRLYVQRRMGGPSQKGGYPNV